MSKVMLFVMWFVILSIVFLLGCKGQQPAARKAPLPLVSAETRSVSWDFDHTAPGKLPPDWQITATNQKGPLATWQVVQDSSAPSGDQVLALTSIEHASGRTFNICRSDSSIFLDGEITVHFKAISGAGDQGGGVIWRALDENNYYVARFNPLEDNFRLYYVQNGGRHQLATAQITLSAETWHTLKIVQQGQRFQGYLNGELLIEGTDDHFKQAGNVGLWTKADAVTSFDDLTVQPLSTE